MNSYTNLNLFTIDFLRLTMSIFVFVVICLLSFKEPEISFLSLYNEKKQTISFIFICQ